MAKSFTPILFGAGALLLLMSGGKKSRGSSAGSSTLTPDDLSDEPLPPPPVDNDPEDIPPADATCTPPKVRNAFGICGCPPPMVERNGVCITEVVPGPVCGPGETLVNGVCSPTLSPEAPPCPQGQALVNGVCVDQATIAPGSIVALDDFVNESQDSYIPDDFEFPGGAVFDHSMLWISDDCRAWVMGRDWKVTDDLEPAQDWWNNDKETLPAFKWKPVAGKVVTVPPYWEWPWESPSRWFGRVALKYYSEVCGDLIPDPEQFADGASYDATLEAVAEEDPGVYALWKALLTLGGTHMNAYLTVKAGEMSDDKDYPLKEGWAAQRSLAFYASGQYASLSLADLTNEAYWWAYPDCPRKLPNPSQANASEKACIARWNRLLRLTNDLLNAYLGTDVSVD